MPITALEQQRRLVEIGRIRLGEKSAKGAPSKLLEFRLTSASKELLEEAASLYGGTVEPWTDPAVGAQHQLATTARELDVLIPPGPAVCSQWMELWSGGGCQRRCDGEHDVISDTPCACPADPEERAELAAKGKACKVTTRLSLILPRVGGLGVWRLESHGWNAALELPATLELARALAPGMLMPATLAIVERIKRRNGNTSRFVVPELRLATSIARIADGESGGLQLGAGATAALPAGDTPLLAAPVEADPLEQRRITARDALADMTAKDKKALLDHAGIRNLASATAPQLDQLEFLLNPGSSPETSNQPSQLEEAPVDDTAVVPLQDPDRKEFLSRLKSFKATEDAQRSYLAELATLAGATNWQSITHAQLRIMAERLDADAWHHNRLSRFRSACEAKGISSNTIAAQHGVPKVHEASVQQLQELIDLVETGNLEGVLS